MELRRLIKSVATEAEYASGCSNDDVLQDALRDIAKELHTALNRRDI